MTKNSPWGQYKRKRADMRKDELASIYEELRIAYNNKDWNAIYEAAQRLGAMRDAP